MRSRKARSLNFETLENRIAMVGSISSAASVIAIPLVLESVSVLASDGETVCFPASVEKTEPQNHSPPQITFSPYSSPGLGAFSQWFDLHRTTLPVDMAQSPTPEALLLAQRSMFLQATAKVSRFNLSLTSAITHDPSVNFWSGSGDTANFLEALFDAFEFPGQFQKVTLWHTPSDHYVGIEYFSSSFGKSVFYDPLYGVMLLDSAGIPAGVHELFDQLIHHGRDFTAWTYHPVRIDGLLSLDGQNATDPSFQFYLDRNYERVLTYYTTIIATIVPTQSSSMREHVTLLHAAGSTASVATQAILQGATEAFTDSTGQHRTVMAYSAAFQDTNTPAPPDAVPSTRLASFAEAIAPTLPDTQLQALDRWVATYLSREEIAANSDPVLDILLAYRRMARIATNYETNGDALLEQVLANPNYTGWGHAGTSVDFMVGALNVLGIQAFRLSLFHTKHDSHTLLGYYDLQRVPQLADPLYGTIFEDAAGVRVGLPYLQSEISQLSPNVQRLNLFSRKVDPNETIEATAADNKFQYFINHDWTTNAHYYMNIVAIRHDTLNSAGSPPDQNWLVSEHIDKTRSPSEREKIALLQSFAQARTSSDANHQSVSLLNWVNTDPVTPLLESPAGNTESTANAYLASLISQPPDITNNAWIDAWLEAHSISDSNTSVGTAERIVDALYRMYLDAEVSETDLATTMPDYLAANPAASIWAQCGSTVELLIQVLRHFNIPARRVQMWHALNDHHVALEYFSQSAGKFVFYDPLYARVLLDSNGVPASFEEISAEAQRYGLQFDRWTFTPVMWGGEDQQMPADTRLSEFFNHNYFRILKYYLNVTAVEHESLKTGQRPDQWNSTAKGTWDVTVRPTYSDYLDLPESMNFLEGFLANYGADERGRFYIAAYAQVDPVFEPSSFSRDIWNRFWTNNETRTEAFATNAPHVQAWLEAHQPTWLNNAPSSQVDAFVLTFLSFAEVAEIRQNAIYEFAQLSQTSEMAQSVANLPAEDQLTWCLRVLGSQATRVVLGDVTAAPRSFIEFVSPGQRKAILIDLEGNQLFFDENGIGASIVDLRIDYERATANEEGLRYKSFNLAMLDHDLRGQPWVSDAVQRNASEGVASLLQSMTFILRNDTSLSMNDSDQVWTLRYTDRGEAPLDGTSLWLQEQTSALLARRYGISSTQIAHVATYASTMD